MINKIQTLYTKLTNNLNSLDFIQHQLGTTSGIYIFKSLGGKIL